MALPLADEAFLHASDPEFPGWCTWQPDNGTRFNSHALGRMIVRREDERSARLQLVATDDRHSNLQGSIHGGVILSLVDVAMFAAIELVLDADAAGSVTVDLHNQFIGAGRVGQPLDVVAEVMKETRRLVFLRGTVEQEGQLVSSFVGTLRKPSAS